MTGPPTIAKAIRLAPLWTSIATAMPNTTTHMKIEYGLTMATLGYVSPTNVFHISSITNDTSHPNTIWTMMPLRCKIAAIDMTPTTTTANHHSRFIGS